MATITDTITNGGAASAMDIDNEATVTTTHQQQESMSSEIQALQDEHYLDHLTEEPLRTLALEATTLPATTTTNGTANDPVASAAAAAAAATVRVEVLEIGLRSEMLKRLQSIMTKSTTTTSATNTATAMANDVDVQTTVGCFWKSALCLCWHLVFMAEKQHADKTAASIQSACYNFDGLSLVRKIPFLLLEDVLDSLPTLEHCQQFWNDTVQPSFALLFHPQVMWTPPSSSSSSSGSSTTSHPCWLPFLKISNKYIRRAAHHHHSSSSSNDTNNDTNSSNSSNNHTGAMTACTVMSTLCNVFPLAEKSATRPWGSHNADHVTSFESLQEFETNNIQAADTGAEATTASATTVAGDTEDDGAVPDYSFYESFWKLQEDLSNPNAIKVADFMQRLKTLITAMESSTTTTSTSTSPTTTTSTVALSASSNNDKPIILLYQPKYLTSSRLLSIQLSNDVDFRRHILCQVLMVIHHLSNQVPVLKSKLEDAQQRAMRLLSCTQQHHQDKSSSSSSLNIVDFLNSLFKTSELQWRNWKKSKCVQDLDQRQSEPLKPKTTTTLGTTATSSVSAAASRKRKRLDSSDGPLSGVVDNNNVDNDDDHDDDDDEQDMTQSIRVHGGGDHLLQSISRRMRGIQPTIQDHLSDYVEALDPDAGIEAEYHPKTNALFCWRAVRLLLSSSSGTTTTTTTNGNGRGATSSTSHLQDFAQISPSGDFEALVREMYKQKGVHIPGETPIYQQDDELDEIEEEKEDEGAKESKHNSPKDEDEEDDKDVDIKMEEDVVDDTMDAQENGENKKETEQKKKPSPPSDDGNDSEHVPMAEGVAKEEHHHLHPDDEPSETGEIKSLHTTKAVVNLPNGKGGQKKDIVPSAPMAPAVNGGNTGKDVRPGKEVGDTGRGGHQRSRSPPDRKSPGRGDDHSKAIIRNPPQGDNRARGRLSPVVHGPPQTAALAGRRNQSENDLARRSAGSAVAGPQQAHTSPPPPARGGGGGGGVPIPPDRRVDHGPPDARRHDGPPPGQRRGVAGGGGGGGPHIDRDDHRRGGSGGSRALSNNGPREDRREDRRMEDRRAADDDRRGSGGEDRRGVGGGGGGGGGGDDRRGGGAGGDDRNRGGDRGDWRPRGGGGRDHSRGRHGRR